MFTSFPKDPKLFIEWEWVQLKPFADELHDRPLTRNNVEDWVKDWSDLCRVLSEIYARLWTATTLNTASKEAKERYNTFLDGTIIPWRSANQELKKKLLASGLQVDGFELALRNMRTEAKMFREENLPLLAQEQKLVNEYDEVIGAQTVEWEGKEVTTTRVQKVYLDLDRSRREKAWRMEIGRKLADRDQINALWCRMLELRRSIALQAGEADYRAYRWKEMLRFDYTPDDCLRFHQAIEQVVVPAATRIYEKRRQRLGLETLRPWDLAVDTLGRQPLKPFQTVDELGVKVADIFQQVDPELGQRFNLMRRKGLLDLENRKDKAPGAYCIDYDMVMEPFIFENAIGVHNDVSTLIHESGHAFHVFEEAALSYYHQIPVGMEMGEVASMGMELLASPYLAASEGGFYNPQEAARVLIEHLEEQVLFWPYMAVVDAFQHWAYTHPDEAADSASCDQAWATLWQRFMPGVDWSGLEEFMVTGWQRKQHIFEVPFYYVEYGMATLGALQVWTNALKDQRGAVAAYRRALALGGTRTLPELYAAAGARFAVDEAALTDAIHLVEEQVEQLETV